MTCEKHPTRCVPGYCFECYEEARTTKYAEMLREVARLASAGVTLLETWPGDSRATAWRWYLTDFNDPKSARITAETLVGAGSVGEHDAFIRGLSPEYLADHLVNRSRGFGTTVTAFCFDCGDETVEITDDDPVCAKCLPKRQDIEPRDAADEAEYRDARRGK